jgi:hypothetical protein
LESWSWAQCSEPFRGSGNIELGHAVIQRCRLTLSGSGNVKIQHLVGLSNMVRLTGQGDIHYRGSPRILRSITGEGELRRIR